MKGGRHRALSHDKSTDLETPKDGRSGKEAWKECLSGGVREVSCLERCHLLSTVGHTDTMEGETATVPWSLGDLPRVGRKQGC